MLLVKQVITEDPISGHESVNIKSMLKLLGNGTSSLENGFVPICGKSCRNPLCGNYNAGSGCTVKDELIKNWNKKKNEA